MSHLPSDYLVERRGLARKVSFWRAAAFCVLIVAMLGFGLRQLRGGMSGPHVARVKIEGLIVSSEQPAVKILRKLAASDAAAVIIAIDSPGGTTTASEVLYDEIRKIAQKKPVVAVVGNLAASGGYIAAIGADRIVAHGNSLVGSIGVLMQVPNVSRLLDTIGVKVEEVKSTPLKAAPSGVTPTSEEALRAMNGLVQDTYSWFKDLVRARRNLSDQELSVVADGRVFTGRQGLAVKLIDQIGGEADAIAWLESEKGVAKNLPIRNWGAQSSFESFGLASMARWGAKRLGLGALPGILERTSAQLDIAGLDGLVSVWQSPASR